MLNDFMGKPIQPGDTIVYPVRRGSNMWLTRMSVQQVVESATPIIHGLNATGRRVSLRNISNCAVVVEKAK